MTRTSGSGCWSPAPAKDPEGASDGAFGTVLMRLLERGPRSPDMQRRWSRHDRMIRGEDLGQALLEEWADEDQRPDFLRRGRAWYMLPNPLFDAGAPEVVVEHLLRAARGGAKRGRSGRGSPGGRPRWTRSWPG